MSRQKRILLVDDEPAILASLGRDLEDLGYLTGTAEDGRQGLALLREEEYDLVITDLVMPGIGGIEVLRWVKSLRPAVGVFILTGYGEMQSAIEALRLGADDYLLKPCDPDEFSLRILRYLERQEALRTIELYENILPICSYCKSIRDDTDVLPGRGEWVTLETYLARKSGAMVSHGCCPKCFDLHKND